MTIQERSTIEELSAYQPVEREGLNLSDNANLFGTNPAIERALDGLDPDEIRQYPSGYGDEIREAIADKHGVDPVEVVVANGSSDLMDLLIRAFTDPGEGVAFHPPSFSMIPLWARCNAAEPRPVPLGPGFELDVDGFRDVDARIGFVCRPNNPTGNAFDLEDVEAVADGFEGLLVVDEAYISFTDRPSAEGLAEREDVALLRSLSKDAGLAGTRFGYCLIDPSLVESLHKVRGPFRVPRPTEVIAKAAIEDESHVDQLVKIVRSERERVVDRLDELGLSPFQTETNFVLVETPWPSSRFADALAEKGVLVRDFGSDALEACVRATIGPPEVNDGFLDAVEELLDEGGP